MSAYSIATRGLAGRKIPQGVLAAINTLLFGSGEQGIAKLDFSDFTGMYQDRARTIPYTAVEQPLGSFTGLNGVTATAPADVNRGVVSARVNLLQSTNSFSGAGWAGGTGIVVTPADIPSPLGGMADKIEMTAVGSEWRQLLQLVSTVVGTSYSGKFLVKAAAPEDIGKVIAFRHAYGSAYLMTTLTADWAWVGRDEVSTNTTTQFTITHRPSVGTTSGVISFHLAAAELKLANQSALPYQRVNTATDYDTAGFPHYLAFNGTNTAYVTPSIDFSGTDKMTVWAGVTKLSDSAVALIAELGVSLPSGGLYLAAPNSVGATFGWASRGTGSSIVTPTGHAAPKNAVLAGIGDIAGDIASLRVNGVATTANTDQGTGNYGNLPLYIGARAGTSLFFNGRLYQLIVRGAATPLPQIEAVETLIRQKMRLP